jgi:hypothetical protein
LYTPPVVVSDDGAIQMIGLLAARPGEVHRYFFSRGSKSRNKVAVGEPAAGSFFRNDLSHNNNNNYSFLPSQYAEAWLSQRVTMDDLASQFVEERSKLR